MLSFIISIRFLLVLPHFNQNYRFFIKDIHTKTIKTATKSLGAVVQTAFVSFCKKVSTKLMRVAN